MIGRLLAIRKTFESGSVDEEDVEPAVIIIINQGDAAAGGLDDVFLFGFRAGHMTRRQARFGRDVLKLNLGRRDAEFNICLRLGRTPWNSHTLTEHVNDKLRAADDERDKDENNPKAVHRVSSNGQELVFHEART